MSRLPSLGPAEPAFKLADGSTLSRKFMVDRSSALLRCAGIAVRETGSTRQGACIVLEGRRCPIGQRSRRQWPSDYDIGAMVVVGVDELRVQLRRRPLWSIDRPVVSCRCQPPAGCRGVGGGRNPAVRLPRRPNRRSGNQTTWWGAFSGL